MFIHFQGYSRRERQATGREQPNVIKSQFGLNAFLKMASLIPSFRAGPFRQQQAFSSLSSLLLLRIWRTIKQARLMTLPIRSRTLLLRKPSIPPNKRRLKLSPIPAANSTTSTTMNIPRSSSTLTAAGTRSHLKAQQQRRSFQNRAMAAALLPRLI